MLQRLLFLVSCTLALNGCVHISDRTGCAVAGVMSAGGICAHLIDSDTNDLTFQELVDFLEPQVARKCCPVVTAWDGNWKPTKWMQVCSEDQTGCTPLSLPARGGAIIMSSEDWNGMKTDLEAACRELGSRCSYEVKKMLKKRK